MYGLVKYSIIIESLPEIESFEFSPLVLKRVMVVVVVAAAATDTVKAIVAEKTVIVTNKCIRSNVGVGRF